VSESNNEVVAESYVRQSIEAVLIRQGLIPMPVSGQSSRSVPTTGKLVDVLQGLSKECEPVTFPRYIADKRPAVALQPQQNDSPATEFFVKRTLESRLYELGRKSFEHTTKVLHGRASLLVATDDLATVEFVQKAFTSVFSPPSAEEELKALAAPYLKIDPRNGQPEPLTNFFARLIGAVSAADLRNLPEEEIRKRIKAAEDRQAEVARENAERREKNENRARQIREAAPVARGPWSI
jgi:hypothetical protein